MGIDPFLGGTTRRYWQMLCVAQTSWLARVGFMKRIMVVKTQRVC